MKYPQLKLYIANFNSVEHKHPASQVIEKGFLCPVCSKWFSYAECHKES